MLLVTGLDGLVSSALISVMNDAGDDLVVLTRRCAEPHRYPCKIITADLLHATQIKECLAGLAFDVVFHAAAAMDGVAETQTDSAGNYMNAVMTANLLDALEVRALRKFVQISSIDVYNPEALREPVTETTDVKPATEYGKSKLASERKVQQWSRTCGVPNLILRVTQVFGEKDRTRKFIPSAIKRIKAGLPVEIFGNGEDLRDYIYSHDVAHLALELFRKDCGGIFNIATGTSRSLGELLREIILVSGKEVEVQYSSRRQKKLDYRFDTGKLKKALPGFELTDFNRALRQTYDHLL
ncbi:MAG: NAD(P)-dependent oxidoreductase [Desulfuromonadales bacterium]